MSSERDDVHGMPTSTAAVGRPKRPAVQRFRVDVTAGPDAGLRWSSVTDSCAIGSHQSNDLALSDPTVSRSHCELRVESGALMVRDLKSRNGTKVDSVRVVEAFVRDGAELSLGTTTLRVKSVIGLNEMPVSERHEFGSLVGDSVPMRIAFSALESAAQSNATVLLTGETGTGKELAAMSLHSESPRAEQPFIIVDCAALPGQLLESELFGHEKGAFTGADSQRIGAFEAASGGTIFLDEIGELPLDMQPKLLRVLERRQIRRLGSNTHIPIDVRVVAATHRDLREEVNADRFRADLYYRLAVIGIRLPPLRERRSDVPAIAEKILADLQLGDKGSTLLTDAFRLEISQHAWPGNVRELRNYLERCVVFGQAVPVDLDGGNNDRGDAPLAIDVGRPFHDSKREWVETFERGYVTALLAKHDGKVTKAAAAAGIGRVLLWKLASKYGLGK